MKKLVKKVSPPVIFIALVALIILFGCIYIIWQQSIKESTNNAEVITVSTLEKIINVNELSTFTAVYNGIAQVTNEKEPAETDYYVSYEARVEAGIDFEKIVISIDDETKTIRISIPEVYITEVNVDISSLDFIFCNDKANTSMVTQQAFKACETDARKESAQQHTIYELAKQNAIKVLTALTKPIVEQLDDEYTLVIE